ncbi:protein kinase domain-containing protein [Nocardia takedensis]
MEVELGSSVGGYVLARRLGSGSIATVYSSVHPRTGGEVVVELVHDRLAAAPDARAVVERALDIWGRLRHPGIAALSDRNVADDPRVWWTTAHFRGGTLADLLRESPEGIDPARALALVTDAAGALDHAHRRGVVHAAVKPSNILIDPFDDRERAVVTDFALAAALGRTPATFAHLAYIAPETLLHDTLDARTDLYALACVLYELLTGRPPYGHDDRAAQARGHLNRPPPSPLEVRPNLPAALDPVFATALAKDPAARYRSGAALVEAVRAVITAPPPPPRPAHLPAHVDARIQTAAVAAHHYGLTTYQAAVRGDSDAMVNLAGYLAEHGEPAEVESWYHYAIAHGHPLAMAFLGHHLHARGDLALAEIWYRRAIRRGLLAVRNNLGNLLAAQGRFDQLDTLLAIDPR